MSVFCVCTIFFIYKKVKNVLNRDFTLRFLTIVLNLGEK